MSTKQSILQESLQLFAKKGYDGVSVREIAGAVGVRESALYKHFKNKEDIMTQVIEESKKRIAEAYAEIQIPETVEKEDIAGGYRSLSADQLGSMTWKLFCFFTKDPIVSNFRRLLMREQYNNPDIGELYDEFFLKGAVQYQAKTLEALVAGGMFREEDPKVMALHFYGPILFLFQRYDCEPESEEEIRKLLLKHVKAFGKNYEVRK